MMKKHPPLRIIYEDDDIIVADKPAGLLTIATEKEKLHTAYRMITDHVRQASRGGRIFIVHRLDRETSGLVVFAKRAESKRALQERWHEVVTERTYVAVVEGTVKEKSGTIRSRLAQNRAFRVYSTRREDEGKPAVTHFRVVAENGGYTMLEVSLETGRKNQIRVHLQELGHSVVGDRRYGARSNPIGRVALHATTLEFIHPRTGEKLRFESPVPKAMRKLVRRSPPERP